MMQNATYRYVCLVFDFLLAAAVANTKHAETTIIMASFPQKISPNWTEQMCTVRQSPLVTVTAGLTVPFFRL